MSTRNQRRKAAHKWRKQNESFWNRQAEPVRFLSKHTARAKGRAQAREARDLQFASGCRITVEGPVLGSLNSTGTRVVSQKFRTMHTGKTWIRSEPKDVCRVKEPTRR